MTSANEKAVRAVAAAPEVENAGEINCDPCPGIETYLTLRQASNRLPGRPSTCSLWRWARVGYGPQKIRLDYSRLGKKILISPAALQEFSAKLIAAETELPPAPKPTAPNTGSKKEDRRRTPEERRIAAELARKRGGF